MQTGVGLRVFAGLALILTAGCRRTSSHPPGSAPPPAAPVAPAPTSATAAPTAPPAPRSPVVNLRANTDGSNTLAADGRDLAVYRVNANWTTAASVTMEALGGSTVALHYVDARGTPTQIRVGVQPNFSVNGTPLAVSTGAAPRTPAPPGVAVGATPTGESTVLADGRELARVRMSTDWTTSPGVTIETGQDMVTLRYVDSSGAPAALHLLDPYLLQPGGA